MTAASLLRVAVSLGCHIEVRIRGGRRVLWADPIDLLPTDLREQIRAHRDELLALIAEVGSGDELPPAPPPLPEPGSAERAKHDQAQERAVTGLMLASHAHTCDRCGGWACFGFGRPGRSPRAWFCPAHREFGEPFILD